MSPSLALLPEPCFPASDPHECPHIFTDTANYSPELVTLLSHQASWTVLQAAPELLDMLESAGGVPLPEAAAAAAAGRGNAPMLPPPQEAPTAAAKPARAATPRRGLTDPATEQPRRPLLCRTTPVGRPVLWQGASAIVVA